MRDSLFFVYVRCSECFCISCAVLRILRRGVCHAQLSKYSDLLFTLHRDIRVGA